MAATVQHCSAATATTLPATASTTPTNPKLKRIVYSKYRELLGSYNDKANAIIETLPAYMVQEDRGFNFETINSNDCLSYPKATTTDNYGSANGQQHQNSNYEAPACVQNAMMTKDKKPFTYTPGGIDLSQIKSERMAKRLQRNAQAEGSTGTQQPRPAQPQSPGGSAAAAMGAAALGMPFQVLPPPPPPPQPGMAGKQATLNGSTPAPPPPPPTNTFSSNSKTLAPPSNGGGPGSAPGSPNMARKSPTPQRFEPPPMGFRPEIKIPPNPMAALRKVPPPVEKNTFWKEAYVKERSKSPMVGENDRSSSPAAIGSGVTEDPQNNWNNSNNNNTHNNNYNYVNDDSAMRKSAPAPSATTTTSTQQQQYKKPDSYDYSNTNQQQSSQPRMQSIQQQYNTPTPPSTPPVSSTPQQQQNSPRSEFRSVTAPQSPAVNVYTRQTDSPRSVVDGNSPQQRQQNEDRATESPFRFAQQQHIQRPPAAMSPLAQQQQRQPQQSSFPSAAAAGNAPAQTVPWRTQRSQPQQQQQQQRQASPQPIYNNVQQSQQQERGRSPGPKAFSAQYQQPLQQEQQQTYEKPTSVGSLYIAPLAQPVEPQAQHIVRQQLQQQQQQRNSPMRQLGGQQQPQQPQQQLRWMSSQQAPKEQAPWIRNEENGNVMPSSLQRLKSPPPPAMQQQQQQQQQQYQQPYYQPSTLQQQQTFPPQQNNGFGNNFGSQPTPATIGLRLQINTNNNNPTSNGPRERIIPIQLEQTPTNTPNEPNFGSSNYGQSNPNVGGYIVRSPNQFVDQGYNNFAAAQQQQQQQQQRVMAPQQLNSPHIIQQQQLQATNNVSGGNKTRIIPISFETVNSGPGSSSSPIVFQNDSRTPPIQSKSFRILQKITDTVDDGSSDDQTIKNNNVNYKNNNNTINDNEPVQLQRPQFARQMSAQDAKSSPPIEQMRRIQIGLEQGNAPAQQNISIQRPPYEQPQQYIPPSEQQVPEPKKYTGSAIPSRSFKLLQAMTTPENAGPGQSDL